MSSPPVSIRTEESTPEGVPNSDIEVVQSEEKGTVLLHTIIDMVASGQTVKDDTIRELYKLLGAWQVRVDLTQVGLVTHSMSRVKKLNQLTDVLETDLLGSDVDTQRVKLMLMSEKGKLALLKILQSEKNSHVSFLTERAIQPTISAPDNMAGALSTEEHSSQKKLAPTHHLPVESRRRVMNMLKQYTTIVKAVDADADVVNPVLTKSDSDENVEV